MGPNEDFEKHGFLSDTVINSISEMRAKNTDWFSLADDLSSALMRIATSAMDSIHTTSWAPEAVAVRVLLRSCGTLQGVILLTERGMVAEGRILVRSLLENAFCIAALISAPDEFIDLLKKDYEASNRNRARFIVAEKLFNDSAQQERLQKVVDTIGKVQTLSPKQVAALGPLTKQYLAYQIFSDDSAHPSARSLHRHMQTFKENSEWRYKWGPGCEGENAATLYHSALATIPIGVGVTELLRDTKSNKEFGELAERFQAMPPIFGLV